jgi:hypothetical protein
MATLLMTELGFDVLSPEMKVMKCEGGITLTFLAESSGKYCILFSHRILHDQEGPLSLEHSNSLLTHLADSLFISLDSVLYPDNDTHEIEWFSSQDEALSAINKMWK